MSAGRPVERAFIGTAALLFAASAAVTIVWCGSMSDMGGMPMPGGWTMSMAWMRMPDQAWLDAAATFLGMWVVMMVAMMLPSLVPMLLRHREAVRHTAGVPLGLLTAAAAAGYFFVWAMCGAFVFPVGVTLAAFEMQQLWLSRAVPLAASAVVLVAGVSQFSEWKRRQLACCREDVPGVREPTNVAVASTVQASWRHGMSLGMRCVRCCAAPMAVLLVFGVMDLRVMAAVTAAITLERLAPNATRMLRVTGAVGMAAGLFLMARAVATG